MLCMYHVAIGDMLFTCWPVQPIRPNIGYGMDRWIGYEIKAHPIKIYPKDLRKNLSHLPLSNSHCHWDEQNKALLWRDRIKTRWCHRHPLRHPFRHPLRHLLLPLGIPPPPPSPPSPPSPLMPPSRSPTAPNGPPPTSTAVAPPPLSINISSQSIKIFRYFARPYFPPLPRLLPFPFKNNSASPKIRDVYYHSFKIPISLYLYSIS